MEWPSSEYGTFVSGLAIPIDEPLYYIIPNNNHIFFLYYFIMAFFFLTRQISTIVFF